MDDPGSAPRKVDLPDDESPIELAPTVSRPPRKEFGAAPTPAVDGEADAAADSGANSGADSGGDPELDLDGNPLTDDLGESDDSGLEIETNPASDVPSRPVGLN